jgi:hypothetical protein
MQKIVLAAGVLAITLWSETGHAQTITAGPPAAHQVRQAPPMPVVLMLVRGAVSAVNQANAANNYEAVRALGTHAFQQRHSNASLSAAFEGLRREGFDLTPVLVTVPELSDGQVMKPDGSMRLTGVFPTRPVEVPFTVVYVEEGGRWRLADLNVGARPAAQAPPAKAQGKVRN